MTAYLNPELDIAQMRLQIAERDMLDAIDNSENPAWLRTALIQLLSSDPIQAEAQVILLYKIIAERAAATRLVLSALGSAR